MKAVLFCVAGRVAGGLVLSKGLDRVWVWAWG